jgi:hypothetical protein
MRIVSWSLLSEKLNPSYAFRGEVIEFSEITDTHQKVHDFRKNLALFTG